MEFTAVLTVLVLFVFSQINFTQSTTITRTFGGDSPADSPLDDIIRQFERSRARLQDTEIPDDCPDCILRKEAEARIAKKKMDKLRIEIIKQDILRKLHMEKPPNVSRPDYNLPDFISLDDSITRRDEQQEDTTSEIYVFPEAVSGNCYSILERPMACFNFHFDTKIRHHAMSNAELWVYKLSDISDYPGHNQTLVLREMTNPNHSVKKSAGEVARIQTTVREGWVKFDLKGPVYRWLWNRRRRTRGLEIICETCQNMPDQSPVGYSGQHKPFFKIDLEKTSRRRHRRSAVCGQAVTSCCMEELYVDFEAIGWHWIMSPRGYYANYCRGSCRELTGIHQWHVARVLTQVAAHTASQDMRSNLAACCAPTSATPLNLIYRDTERSNNLIKKTLHNMIINSCGCM